MKNNSNLMDKYIDPISDKAKHISLEFDTATLNKDIDTLRNLLENAGKSLDEENDASKSMIYYSLRTAYDDLAKLTEVKRKWLFKRYCITLEKASI